MQFSEDREYQYFDGVQICVCAIICKTKEICKSRFERRSKMPYITIESGVLTDTQKEQLIKRLTEVSSEIMNVPQEFFATTIKELPDKNFGIGGKTIDKVKAEYMQTHK